MNYNNFFHAGTFEDKEITHVEGEVDPVRDLDIINEELRLKDEEYFNKNFEELERKCRGGNDKKMKPEYVSPIEIIS
jgi:obg-like ATPase 1